MSTIPLSKSYKPEKLAFPVLLSEKLDGVPVCLSVKVADDGRVVSWKVLTRQGEEAKSCYTIVRDWVSANLSFFEGFAGTHSVVGELVQTQNFRADFKDTGGIARRQECQDTLLSWGLFDYFWDGGDESYLDRFSYFVDKQQSTDHVWVIPFYKVSNAELLEKLFKEFTRIHPDAEGMVARSYNDTFRAGKRNWGYQKMLNEPTIDLRIVSVEEAVEAKTGKGKGMVGRLVAEYKGTTIGIGPGKLTHAERQKLFHDFHKTRLIPQFPNRIAQIKYKAGGGYDALRQPTFQYWRDDKDTPDA